MKITPTYADGPKPNGQNGKVYISAAHEPTKSETPGVIGGDGPPSQQTNEACSAAGVSHVGEGSGAAQPLKIAMIGTAPSSSMLAPFDDKSWTIWGCSPGNMGKLPRVDAWFELHSNLLWPEHKHYGEPYLEWLKKQQIPVYMQDQSQVPNATIFPMREMVAEFGFDFFTSSFAWMMALAIKMGATEIALYGIDMASRDEYILQRPGFYFFRHMAAVRGIKVFAPQESDIMQSPPLYAYVDSTPFGRKIRARAKEVKDRVAPMEQQFGQLQQNISYLKGAQEDIDYFESIWSGVSNEMSILKHDNALLVQRCMLLEAQAAAAAQPVMKLYSGADTLTLKPKRQRRKKAAEPVIVPPEPIPDPPAAEA